MFVRAILGVGAMTALLMGAPARAENFLGQILISGYGACPLGTRLANGDKLSIKEYADLYAIYGTAYGGDGVSNFALPDLGGQVIAFNNFGTGAVKPKGDEKSALAMRAELPIVFCVVTRVAPRTK